MQEPARTRRQTLREHRLDAAHTAIAEDGRAELRARSPAVAETVASLDLMLLGAG